MGGTEFLDLVRQFGLKVVRFQPELESAPSLDQVKLILWLDPQAEVGDAAKLFLTKALRAQVPILACEGPQFDHEGRGLESVFEPLGVVKSKGVVYQRKYKSYDAYTLPMGEFLITLC